MFIKPRLDRKDIVYGRNVIQHEKPVAMTRALMRIIVHEGADVDTALAYVEEN
jgi:class I fructose-bisphosphate aldolase